MSAPAAPAAEPDSPGAYALEKLPAELAIWNGTPAALRLWGGDLGAVIRDYGAQLAPEIPPEAWIGFAINNPPGDEGASPSIWEFGWAGVSGGARSIAGPHSDRRQENNWYDLHGDARVVRPLRRAASMAPDGWRDLRDQTAVGIVSLLDHGYSLAAALDARIRPVGDLSASADPATVGSLWFVTLAFMGWSAGTGRAARVVSRYVEELSRADESARTGLLFALYARDSGERFCPNLPEDSSYSNPFFCLLRTWQKLAAGRLLAQSVGGDVAFFRLGATADWSWIATTITRMAKGRPRLGTAPSVAYRYAPARSLAGSLVTTAACAAVAVAVAAVWVSVTRELPAPASLALDRSARPGASSRRERVA